MCDAAGGVIAAYPRYGAARELAGRALWSVGERYGIDHGHSLDEELHSVPFAVRPGRSHPTRATVSVPFVVERYDVEVGLEQAFTDDMKSAYLNLIIEHPDLIGEIAEPGNRLVIAPNMRLHPAAVADPVPEPFTIGANHTAYLRHLGLAQPVPHPRIAVTVAVLDNGFEDSWWSGAPTPVPIGSSGMDLIPGDGSTSGHGTLMGALIAESAPGATIEPIRMGGSDSTEWDAIHALARAVDVGADVITLSYGQVLTDVKCDKCGLVRQAARSEVFERMIDWAVHAGGAHRALLVAAGNGGVGIIARPASCRGAIPITALDASGKSLAAFANWDPTGYLPVLALPGDDIADGAYTKTIYKGTSFATAYAAALFASGMMRWGITDADVVMSRLDTAGTASNASIVYLN